MPKGASFSRGQPNGGDHLCSEGILAVIIVSDDGAKHAQNVIRAFVAKSSIAEAVS